MVSPAAQFYQQGSTIIFTLAAEITAGKTLQCRSNLNNS